MKPVTLQFLTARTLDWIYGGGGDILPCPPSDPCGPPLPDTIPPSSPPPQGGGPRLELFPPSGSY